MTNSSFPSARQIAALIRQDAGVEVGADSVDAFQAGDPATPVRGVAVTMMPTFDVLERAVAADCNLIIAHEPAFYNHFDDTTDLEIEQDEIWQTKRDFIASNGLVLWRFHDIPHLQRPDAITLGMVEALGWRAFQRADHAQLFELPPTTVDGLARELRDKLGAQTLRVVGEGARQVSKVALAPGAPGFAKHRRLLQMPGVEVLVIGEAREWETIPYVADAVSAELNKALIILGHIPSEQAGMEACARHFEVLLPAVPVHFLATLEPFWMPQS